MGRVRSQRTNAATSSKTSKGDRRKEIFSLTQSIRPARGVFFNRDKYGQEVFAGRGQGLSAT